MILMATVFPDLLSMALCTELKLPFPAISSSWYWFYNIVFYGCFKIVLKKYLLIIVRYDRRSIFLVGNFDVINIWIKELYLIEIFSFNLERVDYCYVIMAP